MGQDISLGTFPLAQTNEPGTYFVTNADGANTAGGPPQNIVIFGQMQASGTALANVAVQTNSLSDAATKFGPNSMIYNQLAWTQSANLFNPVWVMPTLDNPGGTTGTGNIVISGTPTANGTLSNYVGGFYVPVAVSMGQANSAIATATAAAINNVPNAPFTASATTNVVTVVPVHKGIVAGDVDLRGNYRGSSNNEAIPAGLTVVYNTVSGGTGDPDQTAALAALGSLNADFTQFPYSGTNNTSEFISAFNDTSGRWSPFAQYFGHGFCTVKGSYTTAAAAAANWNNQHLSVAYINDSPTPAYLINAQRVAVEAQSLTADPALPVAGAGAGLTLPNVLCNLNSEYTWAQNNLLLGTGISTFKVNPGNILRIDREVTTYYLNPSSQPDNSYQNINTLFQLMYCYRSYIIFTSTNYGKVKLVDNGNPIIPGNGTVSPQIIENETMGWYQGLCDLDICQNPKTFNQNVLAQIQGVGKVAVQLPLDLVSGLYVIGVIVPFNFN